MEKVWVKIAVLLCGTYIKSVPYLLVVAYMRMMDEILKETRPKIKYVL